MEFPGGAQFAFTVFDDADNGTVENVRPVYDLLHNCDMLATKSVWVYPPRGAFFGDSLQDPAYAEFVLDLRDKGFEVGLHNVGDGHFTRAEILKGLEIYRSVIGEYPRIHTNHASNPDNLYWWHRRFEWPVSLLYQNRARSAPSRGGEERQEPWFWGDAAKRHIQYVRNLTFNDINTIACDPRMPYARRRTSTYSNLWFSSSDGQTVREFSQLISPANVDRLEAERGICIVYTHFGAGFIEADGRVNQQFEECIRALSDRPGWFPTVGDLLDYLASNGSTSDPGYPYRLRTNVRWLIDRRRKRQRRDRGR